MAHRHRPEDRGQVRLRPETSLGMDLALLDKDADGSFSWVSWGPLGSKFQSRRLRNVVLLKEGAGVGRLAGRIVWESGQGAGRTPVKIVSLDSEALWVQVRTDREGRYGVDLPMGVFRIAPAIGRGEKEVSVEIGAEETVEAGEIEVPLPRGATVKAGAGKRQGSWRTLEVADGLPDPSVPHIFQDREGYWWFATLAGVSRYAGERFENCRAGRFFLKKYAHEAKREMVGLPQEALDCLVAYEWPGNVRELENAIERAVVLGTGEQIWPEDLPEQVLAAASAGEEGVRTGYHAAMEESKRQIIRQALERCGGSQARAAGQLGLQRTYLSRLMRNLGLR
jgi:hypothetical protein